MASDSLSNLPELTVSELSGAVKRTIEGAFERVRVRAELGRVVTARSGHMYLDLKDERATISGVAWKGLAAGFNFRPEEGLEVIAEGKLSTFPGQSKYQIIIDRLEPAGVGALMALLEERKKKLAAEGLFDEARKKPLPYIPERIGVVTSPTGAVIRDILHRLSDRFPSHVLLWPVLVQGEKAAGQIASAISGFNSIEDPKLRPDLLIVARGGGSIEDLWCFNEEVVARAAANSQIPLISAVGHETDWTLIDFVSDYRAPTPTGAAERAVPVRAELMTDIVNLSGRMSSIRARQFERAQTLLRAASRALGSPEVLLSPAYQKLDSVGLKLSSALNQNQTAHARKLDQAAARLRPTALSNFFKTQRSNLSQLGKRATTSESRFVDTHEERVSRASRRLIAQRPKIESIRDALTKTTNRLRASGTRLNERKRDRLVSAFRMLESVNPKGVLARGYALVHTESGLARRAGDLKPGDAIQIEFADGKKAAAVGGKASPRKAAKKPSAPGKQGDLF